MNFFYIPSSYSIYLFYNITMISSSVILNSPALVSLENQPAAKAFYADYLLWGKQCSIGIRKLAKSPASFLMKWYLEWVNKVLNVDINFWIRTFYNDQQWSYSIFFKDPSLLKNFFDFNPVKEKSFGNLQTNSWIYAKWSSSFENFGPLLGSNKKSPVRTSKIVQAKLQISAEVS